MKKSKGLILGEVLGAIAIVTMISAVVAKAAVADHEERQPVQVTAPAPAK